MGSLPGERSSDLAILHRRTGLTGFPTGLTGLIIGAANCAVARCGIKGILVLGLDWRQPDPTTPTPDTSTTR